VKKLHSSAKKKLVVFVDSQKIIIFVRKMSAVFFRLVFIRSLVVALGCILLLTGCKSSRTVATGRGGTPVSAWQTEDYSRDVADPMARALIAEAQRWIGTRYVYGGESRQGTDCSGLVMRVYGDVCGIKIPRSTREQVKYCTKVARNKMRPGDLVFFSSGKSDDRVSHVGLYIGQGKMIHASSSRGVMVSGCDTGYWGERYFTGARVDKAPGAFAAHNGRRYVPEVSDPDPSLSDPDLSLSAAEAVPAAITVAPATVSAPPEGTTATIDLLDVIINQKVDSIFSSQYVD